MAIKIATLTREPQHDCTPGTLIVEGKVFYTLERAWMENAENISCIPTGIYDCEYLEKSANGKFSEVYQLLNVPDRSGILFHCGNSIADTHGCILIGLGKSDDNKTIINSHSAMNEFRSIIGKDNFQLKIITIGEIV